MKAIRLNRKVLTWAKGLIALLFFCIFGIDRSTFYGGVATKSGEYVIRWQVQGASRYVTLSAATNAMAAKHWIVLICAVLFALFLLLHQFTVERDGDVPAIVETLRVLDDGEPILIGYFRVFGVVLFGLLGGLVLGPLFIFVHDLTFVLADGSRSDFSSSADYWLGVLYGGFYGMVLIGIAYLLFLRTRRLGLRTCLYLFVMPSLAGAVASIASPVAAAVFAAATFLGVCFLLPETAIAGQLEGRQR